MNTSIKFRVCFSTLFLIVATQQLVASTGTTYVVGNCKPLLRSFALIQDALNATPPPTVVQVCPGTYPEQVQITQPVTLQGISSGNSAQAIISASGGLTQTTTDDFGLTIAYQVWVNNVSGSVNINNITIDGSGNGVSQCVNYPYTYVVGIFYQNSSGIVNGITARNQTSGGFCGFGVDLEGGSSNPSVTIENSSIHDFNGEGVLAETNSGSPELTATIRANDLLALPSAGISLDIDQGVTATVTGNFISGSYEGIAACCGATSSISGNTITNTSVGVAAETDQTSVISNKIYNSSTEGIVISSTSSPTVKGNTISNTPTGIEFLCNADPNVFSNAINDVSTGVDSVPPGTLTTNTYKNAATIRSQGACN
jgi:parallel beta-helix repeat protein